MPEQRDPEQAIAEIREKIARGEEPTDEEREFLERERVQLDAERDERTPSDLTG
jgi:predicted  nucleic acid-binding Zn-ribbon protein